MTEIGEILRVVTPEIAELLEVRYNILKTVCYQQPIGRRNLSMAIGLTERVLRKEAQILKENGLLEFSSEGMNISDSGRKVLDGLGLFFHDVRGLQQLESRLERLLNIRKVIVVPSEASNWEAALRDIGKAAAGYLRTILPEGKVLGITGGSTLYHLIDAYRRDGKRQEELIVIPARGGLGDKAEYQANTLAEKLAKKLDVQYKQLYTPDFLSKLSIETLMHEPLIREIIELVERIDVLVFGVGKADTMARRRNLSHAEIAAILEKGAVAEAFGYYFNQEGQIVHELSTIGISLEQFQRLKHIIAVAGGAEKAEAIIAISKLNEALVLVTDEQAAEQILKAYEEEKKND
jgi:central glycolytic genes regulator